MTILPKNLAVINLVNRVSFRHGMMPDTKEPIHLAKLLEPYKGKWVTLTKDEKSVLGSGNTIDEALNAAETKGELMPLLIRVPDENTSTILY